MLWLKITRELTAHFYSLTIFIWYNSVHKDHSKCNYKASLFILIAYQRRAFSHFKISVFFSHGVFSKHSKVHSLIDFNFHSIFPQCPTFFSALGTKLLTEEKKILSTHGYSTKVSLKDSKKELPLWSPSPANERSK